MKDELKEANICDSDWPLYNECSCEEMVESTTSGTETRIARIVSITQEDYDALVTKVVDTLYIIVEE